MAPTDAGPAAAGSAPSGCCAPRSPSPTPGGIESLTMRRLGEDLGVEAMSLYKHVANKDALLDGMVDLVFAEIELPSGDTDWRTAMRDRAVSDPRGAGPPPVGDAADAVADRARARRPCSTTTP